MVRLLFGQSTDDSLTTLAEASFAQSRIYLDEQMRFQSSNKEATAIYNLPLLCRLSKASISIERLRQTLRFMTEKHAILRTSVQLDSATGHLKQYIQSNHIQDWFSSEVSSIDDNNESKTIFHDESINRTYFDVGHGRVFRCHIVRQRSSIIDNTDLLSAEDWIIFNFHHMAFDGESEEIFLDDLQQFYEKQQQIQGNTKLQYIDCKLGLSFNPHRLFSILNLFFELVTVYIIGGHLFAKCFVHS